MLETLLITFREGLEAFLIVAIMLAFVTRTNRNYLRKPIIAGVVVALIISATTGWHIAELAQDPVWEGSLALIAGALVASFTWYIMRNAKHIGGDIRAKLEEADEKAQSGDQAFAEIGVFAFTILMVAREGTETALMLGTISAQEDASQMWIGAMLGLVSISVIAFLWSAQSHRINMRAFLQVTGIFLILFAIHLFMYGIHELSEMSALPFIGDTANMNIHYYSEFIESSWFEGLTTAGLLLVPFGWLSISFIRDRFFYNDQNTSAAAE